MFYLMNSSLRWMPLKLQKILFFVLKGQRIDKDKFFLSNSYERQNRGDNYLVSRVMILESGQKVCGKSFLWPRQDFN